MARRNIVVIDDELLIRDLLYDFFSEKDWGVSVHDTGETALEAIKTKKYDIVLVDLKIPEIDGITIARKIKAIAPGLPVVIMTAFPSVETAIDALHLKLEDYIVKPFNINKLYKTLDEIIEKAQRRPESIPTENI